MTRRLESEEERLNQKQGAFRLLREEVAEEEIADVVAPWTGIPVSRLMEGEREKLLRLDEVLHERVIGQDEAVRLVADAVIRARAGIKDPKRSLRALIFLEIGKRPRNEAAQCSSEDLVLAWQAFCTGGEIDVEDGGIRHVVEGL